MFATLIQRMALPARRLLVAAICVAVAIAVAVGLATTRVSVSANAAQPACNQPGTPAVQQKVVVFAFENRSWSDVGGTQFQSMPYLHSLATQCTTYADYTEPDTSQNSATQYVGTAAGSTANTVRDDCSPSPTCQSTQDNIFRQVRVAGKVPRSVCRGRNRGVSARRGTR